MQEPVAPSPQHESTEAGTKPGVFGYLRSAGQTVIAAIHDRGVIAEARWKALTGHRSFTREELQALQDGGHLPEEVPESKV